MFSSVQFMFSSVQKSVNTDPCARDTGVGVSGVWADVARVGVAHGVAWAVAAGLGRSSSSSECAASVSAFRHEKLSLCYFWRGRVLKEGPCYQLMHDYV